MKRRLSPICQTGYRKGMKPPNWQKCERAHGPVWPPLRSELAAYYRRACGSDWRDYYEEKYTDDGPAEMGSA
jgi:hypothetical protein